MTAYAERRWRAAPDEEVSLSCDADPPDKASLQMRQTHGMKQEAVFAACSYFPVKKPDMKEKNKKTLSAEKINQSRR